MLYNLLKNVSLKSLFFHSFKELKTPITRINKKNGFIFPNSAYFEPTNYCNLRCKNCYVKNKNDKTVISQDTIDKVIKAGKDLRFSYYVFLGGEPLSQYSVDVVLRTIKKYKSERFVICTNGIYINKEIAKEFRKLFNSTIVLSIDGFEETNDKIKGKGVFYKLMNAMELLKQNKILFGYVSVIRKDNFKEISDKKYTDMLLKKGCKYGIYTVEIGNNTISEEDYNKAIKKLMSMPIILFSAQFGANYNLKNRIVGLTVGKDGSIRTERGGKILGDLNKQSLESIIKSKEFQQRCYDKIYKTEEYAKFDQRYKILFNV